MQRSCARLVISCAMGPRSGSGALGELMETLTASSSSGVRELLASLQGSSGPGSGTGSGAGGLPELLEALQAASSSGALRDVVAEGLRAVGPTVKGLGLTGAKAPAAAQPRPASPPPPLDPRRRMPSVLGPRPAETAAESPERPEAPAESLPPEPPAAPRGARRRMSGVLPEYRRASTQVT